jgi:16S rRNA (guanine966-N2)-methyltransferase
MRIIAGSLRGRIISSPRNYRTHPMSEKIRGALFNILGDISGLSVLDAYTGSGALAIEAISRGAQRVVALDNDNDAFACASSNIATLGLQDVIFAHRINTHAWSSNNKDQQFDIVVSDPPHDRVNDIIVQRLAIHVAKGGVYVLSLPSDFMPKPISGYKLSQHKIYGNAALLFYTNSKSSK